MIKKKKSSGDENVPDRKRFRHSRISGTRFRKILFSAAACDTVKRIAADGKVDQGDSRTKRENLHTEQKVWLQKV